MSDDTSSRKAAMMALMKVVSRSDVVRAGATPEFVELCKVLYGPLIDPDVVWDEVFKLSPDQADVNAKGKSHKLKPTGRSAAENIALATNTAGVVAAPAAVTTAARQAARGERGLLFAGAKKATEAVEGRKGKPNRVGRGLRAVSERAGKKGKIAAAALGTGAVGLQLANATGDAISAAHFSKPKETAAKAATMPGMAGMDKLVSGNIKVMSGSLKPTKPAAPKQAAAAVKPNPGRHRAGGERPTQPGRHRDPSETRFTTAGRHRDPSETRSTAAGRDIGRMAGTRSGQALMAGTGLAALGSTSGGGQQPVYYGKSEADEVLWQGEFTKFDDDKRLAFGWASVVEINGQPVIDRQGDYIALDDLEEAAYNYVHKSRVGGDMHRRTPSMQGDQAHKVSDLVESIVFTDDKVAKMGLPDDFPRGWWVGYKVHDDETWGLVRDGERTGFSIHGKGVRKEASMDEVMGY